MTPRPSPAVALDTAALRACFPALGSGTAHFDGPGGSQTPAAVAVAVRDTMVASIANRGTVTPAEQRADDVVRRAREAIADLLGCESQGVVFGRSMTELTFHFARTLAQGWRAGDEIVLSRLDHDANVRPWVIAAARAGVTVRFADFDPATGELTLDDVRAVLSQRTVLVCITGASNLIGTRPDVAAIAAAAHAVGALVYVDGVHLAAHALIDVGALGADLLACSPYKFFGPHCGVVAGRVEVLERLRPDKLLPSSDAVPERFELGTLPYELLAGTTAAVDFLADIADVTGVGAATAVGAAAGGADGRIAGTGSRRDRLVRSFTAVGDHEHRLRAQLESQLAQLDGVTQYARAASRTPTLLLGFDSHEVADAYRFLARRGVNAPAGTFYAHEPATRLGLAPAGGLRIGIGAYTDESDVERLVGGLTEFLRR